MADRSLFTLLFTGIWCLVGAIFLAIGVGLRRSARRREERLRARADGTVTEVVRRVSHGTDGDSVSFYPIVSFQADGRALSLECSDGGGRKTFYEGQSVTVRYDPDDPTCFALEGRDTPRLLGSIFLAVGLGCAAIGVAAGLLIQKFF